MSGLMSVLEGAAVNAAKTNGAATNGAAQGAEQAAARPAAAAGAATTPQTAAAAQPVTAAAEPAAVPAIDASAGTTTTDPTLTQQVSFFFNPKRGRIRRMRATRAFEGDERTRGEANRKGTRLTRANPLPLLLVTGSADRRPPGHGQGRPSARCSRRRCGRRR